MYCPNCKQEYDGKFCPECGTPLIEKPAPQGGINLNIGDANAISGGVHLTDSHNVTNVDNSVHNITNNTSTTNNITNVAAQKTESEILQERKIEFMELVKSVFQDGILEQKEVAMLENERIRIGLDEITAKRLIETVRKSAMDVQHESLSPMQALMLKQIELAISGNQIEQLKRLLPRLEAIAKSTLDEKTHYLYYVVLAAINPQKIVDEYEALTADNYWKTFWAYIGYTKLGLFKMAEDIILVLPRYTQYSEENITLLSSVGAMREFGNDIANDFLNTITGMYSSELENFVVAIYTLISPNCVPLSEENDGIIQFYLQHLLQFEDAEERVRREEQENSSLYNLRLNSAGENSFKVVMVLKSGLGIALSEAKVLVECCPIDILKKQSKDSVTKLQNLLETAGAEVEIIKQ